MVVDRRIPNEPTDTRSDEWRGVELRSYLSRVEHDVSELKSLIYWLPRVDEKGKSDCHFAEDLYAKKAELEGKVATQVGSLQSISSKLNREIGRCDGNLKKIASGKGKLSLKETAAACDSAERAQDKERDSLVHDRDAVHIVLSSAEAVLQVSQSRKFPGKKPEGQWRFPAGPEPRDKPSFPSRLPGGSQLGDLLGMGPLGRGKGGR